jgi:hypothetical protein
MTGFRTAPFPLHRGQLISPLPIHRAQTKPRQSPSPLQPGHCISFAPSHLGHAISNISIIGPTTLEPARPLWRVSLKSAISARFGAPSSTQPCELH